MLESLFPTQRSSLQSAAAALAINNLELDDVTLASSQKFGTSIANNFFNARANDGSATAQTTYTPGNQPGSYQFTGSTQTTVVGPDWGKVRPFAITLSRALHRRRFGVPAHPISPRPIIWGLPNISVIWISSGRMAVRAAARPRTSSI